MDKNIQEWNCAARLYSEFEETSHYSLFCREFISKYFRNIKNKKILDAGCGNGIYTEILTKNGGIVTGCDASTEMLNIAKERNPLYKYDKINLMEKMPYGNNSFDIVFCHLVLMDIDQIDNAISEFYRVLKNKGVFFFSIVHPAFYRAKWEENEYGIKVSKKVTEYITLVSEHQNFWGATMHYHRPLYYYFNKISENGFTFNKMFEPQVYDETDIPDIPLYLFVEFHKN
jgi:ubiquinone/menaquinone biosynthesis C-methylase UbiE